MGLVHVEGQSYHVPLLNIRMMSEEREKELGAQSAVKHYTSVFGHAPKSVADALTWQREVLA